MQIDSLEFFEEDSMVMLSVNIHLLIGMFMFQRHCKCILPHLVTKTTGYVYDFHIFPSNNFAVILFQDSNSTNVIDIQLVNTNLINTRVPIGSDVNVATSQCDKRIIIVR